MSISPTRPSSPSPNVAHLEARLGTGIGEGAVRGGKHIIKPNPARGNYKEVPQGQNPTPPQAR